MRYVSPYPPDFDKPLNTWPQHIEHIDITTYCIYTVLVTNVWDTSIICCRWAKITHLIGQSQETSLELIKRIRLIMGLE